MKKLNIRNISMMGVLIALDPGVQRIDDQN